MMSSKTTDSEVVLLLSLATTPGLKHADDNLKECLEREGLSCLVVAVEFGFLSRLRRTVIGTDLIEAYAARRSLKRRLRSLNPKAVVISTTTAAFLQPRTLWKNYSVAIRFDSPAAINREGRSNFLQHLLERRAFKRARLLMPLSKAADRIVSDSESVVLPLPLSLGSPTPESAKQFLAYAANPDKRGLDLLVKAWSLADPVGYKLVVTGIDQERALRWLKERGVVPSSSIEWPGLLRQDKFLQLLQRSYGFINASRWEDYGSAQLEALAAGLLLITVPSPGTNEALRIARKLRPELVAKDISTGALAASIERAVAVSAAEVDNYRRERAEAMRHLSEQAVERVLREEIVPRLIGGQ